METWLNVHCLQQSLTAPTLLKAGNYENLVADPALLRELVLAFKEGLLVCRNVGINPTGMWTAPLFGPPTGAVARLLRGMFQDPDVATMVKAHSEHGLSEWISGFGAIHASARATGTPTPVLDALAAAI